MRRMLAVVRAHNEERAVGSVVSSLLSSDMVHRVVVVCSGCTDSTEERAALAGADTVTCGRGLGLATRTAFDAAGAEPFVLVDGDLPEINVDAVDGLLGMAAYGVCGRGRFDRPGRASARIEDMAKSLGVVLPPVSPQSLTTAYTSWPSGFGDLVDWSMVGCDRGSDLALVLLAFKSGFDLAEVDLGPRVNDSRGDDHIEKLCEGNLRTLQSFSSRG